MMKAFITIELEVSFTDEETKELDEELKKESKTFKYHVTDFLTDTIVSHTDIKEDSIKKIEINRID